MHRRVHISIYACIQAYARAGARTHDSMHVYAWTLCPKRNASAYTYIYGYMHRKVHISIYACIQAYARADARTHDCMHVYASILWHPPRAEPEKAAGSRPTGGYIITKKTKKKLHA